MKNWSLTIILLFLLAKGALAQEKGQHEPQDRSQGDVHTTVAGPAIVKKKPDKYVLFPVIVHSPEYLWGAGGAGTYYFRLPHDSVSRTSNIKAVGFATLRKQVVLATESNIYFPSEAYILHTILSFSHFPDRFWGIGNTTPESALTKYAISQFDIYPELLRKVYSNFFVGAGYEFQNVFRFTYDGGEQSLFNTENVPGRNGGKISGASLILTWDSRNNAFSPSKGFYAQYVFAAYSQGLGSDFNFSVQNWDVRKYFPLKKNRVLAFQFNMIVTDGDVPIRNLANIGSNSYLRGYYEGRYADQDLIAVQTEYRTHLYKRFGAVFFAGTGKVSAKFLDLVNFSNLKPALGLGLRYALNPAEKLNLRLDAGFGKKSSGTYINLGEAF